MCGAVVVPTYELFQVLDTFVCEIEERLDFMIGHICIQHLVSKSFITDALGYRQAPSHVSCPGVCEKAGFDHANII